MSAKSCSLDPNIVNKVTCNDSDWNAATEYLSGTVYWFGAFWSVYVLVQLYTDESLISKGMCNAS